MSRLASFSLLVAAGSLGAQTLLPEDAKVMLPDYLMAEIEGEGMLGRPWICVLPPPIDFEPYIIDKENEGGTDEPVIAGPCEPYLEPEFLSCVIDESSDGDVILGFNYATGMTALTRRSTGETEVMPMIPASALVAPDAIAPAVMVELNATRLSADGNVVIGSVSWGSGGPFRHRAWGLGGVELLEVPSDSWESAVAEELSSDGAIVVGSAFQVDSGNQQAVRWDLAGKLTALNPIQDGAMGSSARLVTPDGSVIAGDVFSYEGGGIVPFRWSEGDGFRQLGDPLANDDQVIVESLSEDGQVLSGQRYESDGDVATWYWTAEEGFRDVEIAICDFEGEDAEGYKLTGIDPVRRVFVGTFADGSEFLSFNGVSISPIAWMGSITGPVGTLRSAFALSGQAMEGAHHRPIGQLAVPGKATFAWFTGDLGKAWKERDTEQVSGEVGYGLRLGAEGVLGFAFGYSDLDRDYGATGAGESKGAFAVADLGLVLGKSDLTLTAFFGKTDVTTLRNGSLGSTEGEALSLRARYDGEALATLGQTPIRPFVSVTYDHAKMDAYAEAGGIAPAAYDARSQDGWVGRLGLSGKVELTASTDLVVTAEVARVLGENRPDFTGTDVGTGVLDFAVPDVREKTTWGRLGLDLDHSLTPDTILSLTLHASTRGDTFDVSGALSVRKGF